MLFGSQSYWQRPERKLKVEKVREAHISDKS